MVASEFAVARESPLSRIGRLRSSSLRMPQSTPAFTAKARIFPAGHRSARSITIRKSVLTYSGNGVSASGFACGVPLRREPGFFEKSWGRKRGGHFLRSFISTVEKPLASIRLSGQFVRDLHFARRMRMSLTGRISGLGDLFERITTVRSPRCAFSSAGSIFR